MEYVAFVRAINVAGHGRVRMVDLAEAFTSAGCREVRTYVQSGNVIFSTPERESRKIFRGVRHAVGLLLGAEPEIMFRRLDHIRQLVRQNPFGRVSDPTIKLYVAFLARKPRREPRFPIGFPKEALTAVGMQNRDVFIVSRRKKNGFYGFPNNFIEEQLGVPATSRNWSTLSRLVAAPR